MASIVAVVVPAPRLRRFAAWIAGPSAIGSVKGMPSSITSAPPSTSASRISATQSPSGEGSPAVTNVTSAARVFGRSTAQKRWRTAIGSKLHPQRLRNGEDVLVAAARED
jgi:hypothetical protein